MGSDGGKIYHLSNVLAMILAGGEGRRLYPLTKDRAKPAVPFGGIYRIIDITLSNFVNSGIMKIKVITQYKSHSLEEHLARAWKLSPILDSYIEPLPAQQRLSKDWFRGSADAVFQCLNVIEDEKPEHVCIFGGDHIYAMDITQMLEHHIEKGADCTIATIPMPASLCSHFGVVEVDDNWKVVGFEEKPSTPRTIPGKPEEILASMGNYIFKSDVLVDELTIDSKIEASTHDFGKDIIPRLVKGRRFYAYDFSQNEIEGHSDHNRAYWRDVGTIDAYYEANIDLVSYNPRFNLYNPKWRMRTIVRHLPAAKFIHTDEEKDRIGLALNSMVSSGCIVSGGKVIRSILSPQVRTNSFSLVEDSILFDRVEVGRGAKIRRAVIDKDVYIPPGIEIGYDHEKDRKRGFTVSYSGITVVPKKAKIED